MCGKLLVVRYGNDGSALLLLFAQEIDDEVAGCFVKGCRRFVKQPDLFALRS
jgi:hypothetical protein